ncbi:MAG: hypothetical protein SOU49_09475 [Sodaliphilus pleomorphus]|uniref:Uncharacterized protein n=1 Tax=Sodaliphilus pleomorphus TaxID=2606626 RepID=A0A6L5XCL1_9BACT|nr:hypothetical protein [Sodaliphilus pleomorphus]MCI5980572.1 hypothetical protein [Muribaculaceae bacterium]MDY6259836.1 hypothetical protein [Bacteroidales bacterium]MCI6169295.1 hypothetical protein [Muribaculaceae bacterium]MDD6475829.1 hypothetical protein [Sodaliphilus pleomorphus]MDD7065088.1 hypothetical protein [Sodaliphilus pleomorphus]
MPTEYFGLAPGPVASSPVTFKMYLPAGVDAGTLIFISKIAAGFVTALNTGLLVACHANILNSCEIVSLWIQLNE